MEKGERGKLDDISFYRLEPTGRMLPRVRTRKGIKQEYFEPEMQHVYFSKEFVDAFSVDQFGHPVHSKIKYYTTIENYFLDFWGPILGAGPAYTFVILVRYCYGTDDNGDEKDYAFPELDTLAELIGVSEPTVKEYMDVLEKNYFIYRFWRKDRAQNNKNKSILYKLRTSIPYLSEEQIELLSPQRQFEHSKFLKRIAAKFKEEIALPEKNDFTEEYENIMKSGAKAPLRKMTTEEIILFNHIRKQELWKKQTEDDKLLWERIVDHLQNGRKIAKTSMETWFGNTFCVMYHESKMMVYAPSEFAAEWIRSRYIELIRDAYKTTEFAELEFIEVEAVEKQIE